VWAERLSILNSGQLSDKKNQRGKKGQANHFQKEDQCKSK
jgi:hypothetical protein